MKLFSLEIMRIRKISFTRSQFRKTLRVFAVIFNNFYYAL